MYGDYYAIIASPGFKRYAALSLLVPIFFVCTIAVVWHIRNELIDPVYSVQISFLIFVYSVFFFFGFLTFINLKNILAITEVLLVPEERKIIIRRERSKKVVSEHSVDDIKFQHERVSQEDPSTPGMYWFTLYDTKLKKHIFSIRPGESQSDDAMAVGELEEFFNEIMHPEEYAKKRQQEQKEIEERNRASRKQREKAKNDTSKWDSLT